MRINWIPNGIVNGKNQQTIFFLLCVVAVAVVQVIVVCLVYYLNVVGGVWRAVVNSGGQYPGHAFKEWIVITMGNGIRDRVKKTESA